MRLRETRSVDRRPLAAPPAQWSRPNAERPVAEAATPIVGRVHPRQHKLPTEIEEVWLAALADAQIDPDEALLYVLDGENGSNGYAARYLYRHLEIHPEDEADEIEHLLGEMNSDDCIDAYRVAVFRERAVEGIAALIRHELEHAHQRDVHGQALMEPDGSPGLGTTVALEVRTSRALPQGAQARLAPEAHGQRFSAVITRRHRLQQH